MTAKRAFNETFHRFTRQLHLYGGLFLCPFLLIFAISTIRLNHGWQRPPDKTTTTMALPIPADRPRTHVTALCQGAAVFGAWRTWTHGIYPLEVASPRLKPKVVDGGD